MKAIELSKQTRSELLGSLKEFFAEECDKELSDFKASIVLDFVLREIGPSIYNQAIADAYQLMTDKIEDLYSLEKKFR